ncbi:MAG: thiosulfate reductase [Syntrophobacteraceae bacterium CG07_land_8_20_14_0_80_61_8]|nr:MAG: thiosulfate reductase [Syntrophobacteraceae bacterium CG07_land_8_20_14_0_80_61_8]
MASRKVYSVCGMCTVRCPILADVTNGVCSYLQGNPHAAGINGALCARGAAGLALTNDNERPQFPLIRAGERGEGKWRQVSWDEALDYTAERLDQVRQQYGSHSILFSDRGGPFRDLHQAFVRGLGSPNYSNHDASCARNVQHAALSVFGFGRKDVVYDLKNSRHVVLQTRNLFEAINVKEVNDLMSALDNGCKLTVIDIRATVTSTKADKFFMVRPGTDYAFNLAVIHVLLSRDLYDQTFAGLWIKDLGRLQEFIRPYTPEWAERETGIPADALVGFVRELAASRPAVIWHPGWMTARYTDSFHVCRSIYIINALLGSIGAKGGLPFANKPSDFERKGLKKLADLFPKPEQKRADGVGWRYPHFDAGPGLLHLAFKAIETEDPYPVKAYIAYRHDPLMGFPDQDALKRIFRKLDFLVSVTFSWSDSAWFSDIVLPLSPYLERESILACKNGLKPYFFLRHRAQEPRFDTRADWEILTGLAKRLGLAPLAFESIEDIWKFQLNGTGVSMADFEATGMVSLAEQPLYRKMEELKFKTPSGKIELICDKLEKQELPSLKPYQAPAQPPEGMFRIAFGRCAVHTQGHTVNNPLLNGQMAENVLWLNRAVGEKMKIADGEQVEVISNGHSGRIKAMLTDLIHPEAAFMVHGFGHTLPVEIRAFGKGVADNCLMPGGLEIWDPAGGALALQEHFITVRRLR